MTAEKISVPYNCYKNMNLSFVLGGRRGYGKRSRSNERKNIEYPIQKNIFARKMKILENSWKLFNMAIEVTLVEN